MKKTLLFVVISIITSNVFAGVDTTINKIGDVSGFNGDDLEVYTEFLKRTVIPKAQKQFLKSINVYVDENNQRKFSQLLNGSKCNTINIKNASKDVIIRVSVSDKEAIEVATSSISNDCIVKMLSRTILPKEFANTPNLGAAATYIEYTIDFKDVIKTNLQLSIRGSSEKLGKSFRINFENFQGSILVYGDSEVFKKIASAQNSPNLFKVEPYKSHNFFYKEKLVPFKL